MLNDASGFKHIYLCAGYTDLRKGIEGLISIVSATFGLDPTDAGSIFLFCGRRNDRMKALLSVSYTHLCAGEEAGRVSGKYSGSPAGGPAERRRVEWNADTGGNAGRGLDSG